MGQVWAAVPESLRDIKGPVGLGGFLHTVLAAAIVLLVLATVVFIFLKKRKQRPVAPTVKSAHEIAREQLEALRLKGLILQGRIKEYYSELSDIIRVYLENRFSLKAPEMTTEEFLSYARDCGRLSDGDKKLLADFLAACDLVKFARHSPSTGEIEAMYNFAARFVEQTKEGAHDIP